MKLKCYAQLRAFNLLIDKDWVEDFGNKFKIFT